MDVQNPHLDIVFRPPAPQDIDLLAGMNKRLIEDERHPNPMTVSELADRMRGWLESGYRCIIAWNSTIALGYCLHREEDRYYYMRQLYTERDYRHRGVATALLNWMFQHHWTDKPVRLDVFAHNEAALALYKSYGFSVAVYRMELKQP